MWTSFACGFTSIKKEEQYLIFGKWAALGVVRCAHYATLRKKTFNFWLYAKNFVCMRIHFYRKKNNKVFSVKNIFITLCQSYASLMLLVFCKFVTTEKVKVNFQGLNDARWQHLERSILQIVQPQIRIIWLIHRMLRVTFVVLNEIDPKTDAKPLTN